MGASTCQSQRTFKRVCYLLENAMFNEMEPGINPYALDYPVCLAEDGTLKVDPKRLQRFHIRKNTKKFDLMQLEMDELKGKLEIEEDDLEVFEFSDILSSYTKTSRRLEKYTHYKPCEEDYFTAYLNRDDVREAIHVHEDIGEWEVC